MGAGGLTHFKQCRYMIDNCWCKAACVVVKVTPGLILRKMGPEKS